MTSQDEGNPFEPENDLDCEHITPETPVTLYDTILWQALRIAIDVSETKADVFRLMTAWNNHNEKKLNEKEVTKKTHWGLVNFDSKFKGK